MATITASFRYVSQTSVLKIYRVGVSGVTGKDALSFSVNGLGNATFTLEPGRYELVLENDRLRFTVGTASSYALADIVDIKQ